MSDLSKIVGQMPRKGAEAEPLEDFPLRDQAPKPIEDVRPVIARPRGAQGLLDGAEVQSLANPPRLTEAEYAEKKQKLPPLIHAAAREKAKARSKPRFGQTWSMDRRDIAGARVQAESDANAKADLSKAVSEMPMRWDKPGWKS